MCVWVLRVSVMCIPLPAQRRSNSWLRPMQVRCVTYSVLGYFVCALSACLDNNCNNYMHPACTDTTDRLALLARHRLGESVLLALRSVVCVVCCTPYSRGVCIVCCLHADMAAELEKLNKQLVAKNAVLNKENEDYSGVCYTLFL